MKIRLIEAAEVIRSKNSGPYELTLDLIFREGDLFQRVCQQKVFTPDLIASLYGINPQEVVDIIEFFPAKAIKINIRRPIPSGNFGETDVYGAQQHAPLLGLEFWIE